MSKIGSIEGEIAAAHEEMASLREVISSKRTDSEKEAQKKEKLESELKSLRGTLEARQTEVRQAVAAPPRWRQRYLALAI